MKKLILLTFLSICGITMNAQVASWITQATGFTPVSSGVRNISIVDSNIVWISSYDGAPGSGLVRQDFSRTIDGGTTWTPGVVPTPNTTDWDWSMIFGLNADTAWAMMFDTVIDGGGIWRTNDGGLSWAQQGAGTIFNSQSFPDIIHFWNADSGIAIGDPNPTSYEIYTTVDGGTNWVPVPIVDIPAALTAEATIIGHYDVKDDIIWFDTHAGRVYRSIDRGYHWTVSNTNIPVPSGSAIDICFYSPSNGIARRYNTTTGVNQVKTTSDSGTTWTTLAITGTFYGSDVEYIPGTASRLISSGAATGFIGSSYSDNGGQTWTTLETLAQRTALGAYDSLHIWAGGFTNSTTSGGIYKNGFLPPVNCGDPSITAGTTTASDTGLCDGDTVIVTSTGVVAPNVGTYYGVSWIITNADISGSDIPLLEPSFITTYNITMPATSTSARAFINDGAFINGSLFPYGVYYWTPCVFGNATAGAPPTFMEDLLLQQSCTVCGTSLAVNVHDPNSLYCINLVGIQDLQSSKLSISAYLQNDKNADLIIDAVFPGKAVIEVFDLTGMRMSSTISAVSFGRNHEVLNIQNYANGIYIIKVTVDNKQGVTKLVKM